MIGRPSFRDDHRTWGWPRFTYSLAMRALKRYPGVHVYVLQVRAQDPDAEVPALAPGLSMRIASREELLWASADSTLGLAPGSIEAALDRGDLCVAAFEGERLIAYVWRRSTSVTSSWRVTTQAAHGSHQCTGSCRRSTR